MANLKELKDRIASVKSTQKITKAMKMVAASKLRRAETELLSSRPYLDSINKIFHKLLSESSSDLPKLMQPNDNVKTALLIVCTSDRGLCGAFNSSIVKKAKEKIRNLYNKDIDVKIITIGKKAFSMLKTSYRNKIIKSYDISEISSDLFANVKEITKYILDSFENNEFDTAFVYFSVFQSVLSQIPTEKKLIPIEIDNSEEKEEEEKSDNNAIVEFEPEKDIILKELCPLFIDLGIFKAIKENSASEQGARMSAMENATRNAGEMIDNLALVYNSARQAQITKELIEVISGAESV